MSAFEYVRLASIEKDQRSFLGDRSTLAMHHVRITNLDTDQVLEGIEVSISTSDRVSLGTSIGLSSIGSLWGTSAQSTFTRINDQGHILLSRAEVQRTISFLNQVIGETGKTQSQMKLLKLSLRSGFEIGLLYDPDHWTLRDDEPTQNPWQFIISTQDVSYVLGYSEGLDILRTLSSWAEKLEALQAP